MENGDDTVSEVESHLVGSEVTSLTFAIYYFVIAGLKHVGGTEQRRWELRSSNKVRVGGALHRVGEQKAREAHEVCGLVSAVVCKVTSKAKISEQGLMLDFEGGGSLFVERDVCSGLIGEVEGYVAGVNTVQSLEGTWTI